MAEMGPSGTRWNTGTKGDQFMVDLADTMQEVEVYWCACGNVWKKEGKRYLYDIAPFPENPGLPEEPCPECLKEL